MITWNQVLDKWNNGEYPNKKSEDNFFFETSVCTLECNNIYEEKYILNKCLDEMDYDSITYSEYINKSTNIHVTSFQNLSGDAILVIPIPTNEYITIRDFFNLANEEQKYEFWKYAANEIKEFVKINGKCYVSTHGLGIGYFHLRICKKPKYYISNLKYT